MGSGSSYTITYIHQDSLGSTSLVTDSNGAQVGTTMKYLPFGLTQTGSVNTTKEFTGQRLDSTGLYYYNARYYDPQIGRFISADTVVQNPANPQTLNRYSYCINNPLKYIDPSGHDQVITTIGDDVYEIRDGNGNFLGTASGIDDLSNKMAEYSTTSRDVDLPLGQGAADYLDAIANELSTVEKAD